MSPSDTPSKASTHRPVRSFVRREGRLTKGQQRALSDLLPIYSLPEGNTTWNLDQVFARQAKRTLEIGFGNGETLAAMAAQAPKTDFIGIEVHRPGVGYLLERCEAQSLTNVRVSTRDAIEVLQQNIASNSLDEVKLFFPDPWPKKKHRKRRIVQPDFLTLVATRLKPGAFLHMATDWANYAEHMLAVGDAAKEFENTAGKGQYSIRPDNRPETKFERRGLRLGHQVVDLIYRRCN